jgi:hypothetical protein
MTEEATRRTKRRYAHELYPHGGDFEIRPLTVEVPYLYARAQGFALEGSGWFENPGKEANARTYHVIDAIHMALLADALLQGMTGDEAWKWVQERRDYEGEWAFERSKHYGVPMRDIKPYPCGPEPDYHDHYDAPDASGWQTVHRIPGPESECEECTEPIDNDDTKESTAS